MNPLLAFALFHEPMPIDAYWLWLLLPLVVAVSVVYKTIKIHDLANLPRQAAIMAAQIVAFMILAAAAIWLIVELA